MNKKNLKKITSTSLVVVFSLIFTLSILNLGQKSYATITEENNKGIINVSNIECGIDVYLYQIATLEYDYTTNKPYDDGYKWENNVQEWIDTNYAEYSNIENFYNDVKNNSTEAQNFYDDITSAIKSGSISIKEYNHVQSAGNSIYPVTTENLTGNIQFTDVEMGSYIIIIENGYMVYTPSVAHVIPSFDENTNEWVLEEQEVVVKAINVGIKKIFAKTSTTVNNYGTDSRIIYTIVTDVPNYLKNSLSKKYYISDKLDSSMIIDESSIKISGIRNGEGSSIETYDLTYNTTRPNTNEEVTFLIDLNYEDIQSYDQIEVRYAVNLNQNSTLNIGAKGNINKAYLDYSNNPYDTTSLQTQIAEDVITYTYGIEITSVDKTDTSIVLAGSEFELYDSSGNILSFIQTEEGVYYLANSKNTDTTTTLVTDQLGKLYLYGLDEGTYSVKETNTPDGYNISSKMYEIELLDSNLDGKLDDEDTEDGIYELTITNSSGFVLPITGGNGTKAFIGMGVILISISLLLLIFIIRRKTVSEEQ